MAPSRFQLSAWLCEALRSQDDTVVEALLQQGANPNLVLPEGMAPIHLAAGMEQKRGIRCLALILQYGGDPNARSVDNLTPVHVAALWSCYTCLRLLLMEGGDPRLEDQDGNTALDMALEEGDGMCVRILREALEEKEEEQSTWMSHRRSESFLSTTTEDTVEAGGACRDCLSASFLTECSWKCSALCDHSKFPTQMAASSKLPFGNVGRKQTSFRPAIGGFPQDGPLCPKLDAYVNTTPSFFLKTSTVEGCLSSPDQNNVLPKATSSSSESQADGASLEIPSTTRSQEILDPLLTCAMQSKCKTDHFLGGQNGSTTLDLTQYSSFLDPDLMVKLSSQQGLDIPSPDHRSLVSQENSTTVSDLEQTLVVSPAFLPAICKNPDGCCTRVKPFRGSLDDVSSQYFSCNSECDASTLETPGCSGAQRYREGKASFGCSPGSSDSSQRQSLLSRMSHDPRSSEDHVMVSPSAAPVTVSPSKSQTLRHSQASPDLREMPSKTPNGPHTLGLCSTGGNGCSGNVREQVLFRTFQEKFPGKCPWQQEGGRDQNTIPLQESQNLIIARAANQVLPEDSSIATSNQVAIQELQREFGIVVSSNPRAELNEEKGKSLQTQDTLVIQRASEERRAFLGSETPVSPGTSEDADDTVPISCQAASVIEEELSSLDTKLRSMSLATKACHWPLLQPKQESCHITPCSKSCTAMSVAHNNSSRSSSLFDETLETPRYPTRERSHERRVPNTKEACSWPVGPRNKTPPHVEGEEIGVLDSTQLIPSSCPRHNLRGSIPLGPSVADLALLTESGRNHCRRLCCLEVKHGSRSSADSERKSPLKEAKPSQENERDAALSQTDTKQSVTRHGQGKRSPKPTRVSFSRLSPRGPLFVPGAPSCLTRRLNPVKQVVPLSPGRQPVNVSTIQPVEYLYVDEDKGHTLVERHVPCTDNSITDNASSEDGVIYDWRAHVNNSMAGVANKWKSSPQAPSEPCGHLSDEALIQKLRDLGVDPGPITGLTRKFYVQRLEKLMSDPKDSAGYSPELTFALETYQIPDSKSDEMALMRQFDQLDKSKKWREGLLKSCFNYLLLDPRVTHNLPFRCQYLSQAECFRTFVSAIFYVGKGKGSRPYSHLYEALTHYKGSRWKQGGQACSKVKHILEIWASGQGVISMHCFHNVIPVEAYTREACMVDAIGLKMLTNQKKGNYYGLVAGWPMKRRRRLGIYLLHRAMQIFLAEGERQLHPADIQSGW